MATQPQSQPQDQQPQPQEVSPDTQVQQVTLQFRQLRISPEPWLQRMIQHGLIGHELRQLLSTECPTATVALLPEWRPNLARISPRADWDIKGRRMLLRGYQARWRRQDIGQVSFQCVPYSIPAQRPVLCLEHNPQYIDRVTRTVGHTVLLTPRDDGGNVVTDNSQWSSGLRLTSSGLREAYDRHFGLPFLHIVNFGNLDTNFATTVAAKAGGMLYLTPTWDARQVPNYCHILNGMAAHDWVMGSVALLLKAPEYMFNEYKTFMGLPFKHRGSLRRIENLLGLRGLLPPTLPEVVDPGLIVSREVRIKLTGDSHATHTPPGCIIRAVVARYVKDDCAHRLVFCTLELHETYDPTRGDARNCEPWHPAYVAQKAREYFAHPDVQAASEEDRHLPLALLSWPPELGDRSSLLEEEWRRRLDRIEATSQSQLSSREFWRHHDDSWVWMVVYTSHDARGSRKTGGSVGVGGTEPHEIVHEGQ